MKTKELRDLLDISILAPRELSINSVTSTRFAMCLWGELRTEDREKVIDLLTKAHKGLGRKIRRAKIEELDALIVHCNQILTREAVLAGVYPKFRRHAVDLKDIFLEDIMVRWNKDKRPGATMQLDEIVQVFHNAIRERGPEGIKPIE